MIHSLTSTLAAATLAASTLAQPAATTTVAPTPPATPTDTATPTAPAPFNPDFGALTTGDNRVWYSTLGFGVTPGGSDDGTHANVFHACSTFIGNDLEVQFELSGWYFDQEEDNTAGGGFAVNLRWHALSGAYGGGEGKDWTLFADAGIGLILSADDVPDGGSSLNLAPRIGAGFTARLGDSATRLVGGIRWHHMSNARSNGDDENPDFNAPMFYLGVQWPFGS